VAPSQQCSNGHFETEAHHDCVERRRRGPAGRGHHDDTVDWGAGGDAITMGVKEARQQGADHRNVFGDKGFAAVEATLVAGQPVS
jgi:hypothetical protein